MALSSDRNTREKVGNLRIFPVAASTKLYAGAIACLNASGDVVPGSTSTTLKTVGRVEEFVDNSQGIAGDATVKVKSGTFLYKNSASADEITKADIGSDCFIIDDETVAKTNGTNTRSIAGKVSEVDTMGVWVKLGE